VVHVARVAHGHQLLTEDNLPSYHRTIAEYFTIGRCMGGMGETVDREETGTV